MEGGDVVLRCTERPISVFTLLEEGTVAAPSFPPRHFGNNRRASTSCLRLNDS